MILAKKKGDKDYKFYPNVILSNENVKLKIKGDFILPQGMGNVVTSRTIEESIKYVKNEIIKHRAKLIMREEYMRVLIDIKKKTKNVRVK